MFKYVMFRDETTQRLVPIIFPKCLVHADVAEGVARSCVDNILIPVSAGFCSIKAGIKKLNDQTFPWATFSVYGGSETLKLGHHSRDAEIMDMHPWEHGIHDINDLNAVPYQPSAPNNSRVGTGEIHSSRKSNIFE